MDFESNPVDKLLRILLVDSNLDFHGEGFTQAMEPLKHILVSILFIRKWNYSNTLQWNYVTDACGVEEFQWNDTWLLSSLGCVMWWIRINNRNFDNSYHKTNWVYHRNEWIMDFNEGLNTLAFTVLSRSISSSIQKNNHHYHSIEHFNALDAKFTFYAVRSLICSLVHLLICASWIIRGPHM